jgi:hypothetical protein
MSNLVNKPIVDKNGIVTSRKVNPDKNSGSTADRSAAVGAPPKASKIERKPLEKLRMDSASYTVGHWLSARDQYDFDAPYQRGSVWDTAHKQGLIRSLLLGIPTGSVILNKRPFGSDHYGAVVDGKQRIEAVLDFMEDRLEVPNEWFDESQSSSEEEMVKYSDLSEGFQRSFRHTTVLPTMEASVETIEQEAEIFLLINQGGVEQEDSTIDNAKRIAG